jgi:hypothetical protein
MWVTLRTMWRRWVLSLAVVQGTRAVRAAAVANDGGGSDKDGLVQEWVSGR